jgi:hypothetical protein
MSCTSSHTKSAVQLGDIFRKYQHLLPYTGDWEWKVINAITSCRTWKLGSHDYKCDTCGQVLTVYNSCRNRHCPQCLGLAKAEWILNRDRELLPVHYFHLVFTLPHIFNHLVLQNKREMFNLLFKAASQTLKEVIAHPDNLGVHPGFFSILHTWDQRLNLHPHIHCVVPGGGLSPDKTSWVSSSKKFLVSVKKLSRVFRGKFLSGMDSLYKTDKLTMTGNTSTLKHYGTFKAFLKTSTSTDWVVYAKPPFNGPHWVLRYLARYTHRIAISNSRIHGITADNKVLISWQDRKHGYVKKTAAFDPVVFMQKFLLHVLPFRFVRIRYYGFMGNTIRKERIALIRVLLEDNGTDVDADDANEDSRPIPSGWVDLMIFLTGEHPLKCKACGKGQMVLVEFTGAYRIRDG